MRNQFNLLLLLVLVAMIGTINAQSYSKEHFNIKKVGSFKPHNINDDPFIIEPLKLIHAPGGDTYTDMILDQKRKSKELFPRKQTTNTYKSNEMESANVPIIGHAFDWIGPYLSAQDTAYPIIGDGTPLDNTLAVSNGGYLMTAINTKIYAHDIAPDTAMYETPGIGVGNYFRFNQFADIYGNISTYFPFDPKLLYDPNHDRFVLTFISGRFPSNTKIIMGFSSTNNPKDEWHLYEIPGNPRDTNEWTDYPAMALSQSDVFLTINLIIDGVSWQEGFNGSLIWQMGLDSAYAGADSIEINMWDNIKFNDKFIRNLNPVAYAMEPDGDHMYFLSNRNFDLQNDTIFLVEVTGAVDNENAELILEHGLLDTPYGMPPNGQQEDTDTLDATKGLQTNDARWLGALLFDDNIQFVGNTMNFDNGRASIYHGKIENLDNTKTFTGNIISSDTLDLGYPNMAFTGKFLEEQQVIIGFEHTSLSTYPGISAIYYSNDGTYSDILRIKEGDNYIDQISNDSYERWGDYFGIQRKYNEPGKVWTSGVFGLSSRKNSVHLAELISPDTSSFEPSVVLPVSEPETVNIYPNPFFEQLNLVFEMHKMENIQLEVVDISGKTVYRKDDITVSEGFNKLSLSSRFFPSSTYIVNILNEEGKQITSQKVIKR